MKKSDKERLLSLLDGSLSVTFIVLNLDLESAQDRVMCETERIVRDHTYELPFLPFRAAQASSSSRDGDIGLGLAYCRSVVLGQRASGDKIGFGRSLGTVRDAFSGQREIPLEETDETLAEIIFDDGIWFYLGPPQRCLSLWSSPVRGYSVLVVEDLDRRSGEVPCTVRHEKVDLIRLLSGNNEAEKVTLRSLGFDLTLGDVIDRPLTDLIAISVDSVRGNRLARALTVVAEAGVQDNIELFLDLKNDIDFDRILAQQETGYVPTPVRLDLVEEPAIEESFSAMSADGRIVLLNIDSLSFNHDYLGFSTERILLAVIPVLCDLSSSEVPLERLRESLEAGSEGERLNWQLHTISQIRLTQLSREFSRSSTGLEQAVKWGNSGQLASSLYVAYGKTRRNVSELTERTAEVIESVSEYKRNTRLDWTNFAVAALTVLGTILAGLGVLAALVSVPSGLWHLLAEFAPLVLAVPVGALVILFRVWWMGRDRNSY